MIIKPEYKDKAIRSFVIRSGRMTESQRSAFEQWWPHYGLSLHNGMAGVGNTIDVSRPLVVEVGFGMGDSLCDMAQALPDVQFIGIEVHPPGVGRLINRAAETGLKNIWVFMADATDVLEDCFQEASIDRLQLYFPDPWHKKKHHKRRIVQAGFLKKVIRALKPKGILHMATDWEPYAHAMLDEIHNECLLENIAGEKCFSPRPEYRPKTKFELRGERLGHGVWDILARKCSGMVNPDSQ